MNQPAESGDARSDLPLVRPVIAGSERLTPTGDAFPELAPPLRVSPSGGRPAPPSPAPAPEPEAYSSPPIAPPAPGPEVMGDAGPDARPDAASRDDDDEEGPFDELPWLISDDMPTPASLSDPAGAEAEGVPIADSAREAFDSDWGAPWDEQETGGEAPASRGSPGYPDGAPLAGPDAGAPFELYQEAQESVPTAAAPQAGAAPDSERSRAEHMAARLDAIARLLRERGPTGPLASGDPLGALITGYLLGSTGSEGPAGAAE
jgi:hypothetical protein